MSEIQWKEWQPTDAAASAATGAEATEVAAQEEASGETAASGQLPPEIEERLQQLEQKLKEADWALRVNELAAQNPKAASEVLRKAADILEGQVPAEPQESFDPNAWLAELEHLANNPPVSEEWLSDEGKWVKQLATKLVEGIKKNLAQAAQLWAQILEQQEKAETTNAVEAAMQRVESEIATLKERYGSAWNDALEEKILRYMDKVAEEEDRVIFPVEALGRLVAEGQVPPPPMRRPTPAALVTPRPAPGATMRTRQRPASIDEAIKATFLEFGIPVE